MQHFTVTPMLASKSQLHRQLQTLLGSTQVGSHDILTLTIHVMALHWALQEAIAHLPACFL